MEKLKALENRGEQFSKEYFRQSFARLQAFWVRLGKKNKIGFIKKRQHLSCLVLINEYS